MKNQAQRFIVKSKTLKYNNMTIIIQGGLCVQAENL